MISAIRLLSLLTIFSVFALVLSNPTPSAAVTLSGRGGSDSTALLEVLTTGNGNVEDVLSEIGTLYASVFYVGITSLMAYERVLESIIAESEGFVSDSEIDPLLTTLIKDLISMMGSLIKLKLPITFTPDARKEECLAVVGKMMAVCIYLTTR